MAISVHNIPQSDINSSRNVDPISLSTLPTEIFEKILGGLTMNEWRGGPYLVCKQWVSNLTHFIGKQEGLLGKVYGSDKWSKKWSNIEVFPRSTIPDIAVNQFLNFASKPCPFEPGKLFIETHIVAYIGNTIHLKEEASVTPYKMTMESIHTIFERNRVFCLFNLEPGSGVEKEAQKARWIALYKGALCVYRIDGTEIAPSEKEVEKLEIAEKEGYRIPTIFDFGICFFATWFITGEKCTTWLSEKDRHTVSADTLDDDRYYVDDKSAHVATQRQSFDGSTSCFWSKKGTFGYMVCKDL